jgi:hypothetical protein
MNFVLGDNRYVSSIKILVACCQLDTNPLGLVIPLTAPEAKSFKKRVNLFAIQYLCHKKTRVKLGLFVNITIKLLYQHQ